MNDDFANLKRRVIDPGICTHCGTCVGLASGRLGMAQTRTGPLPEQSDAGPLDLPGAWDACPGKGLSFRELNEFIFDKTPANWLLGSYRRIFIASATDPSVRGAAASGGIITAAVSHLLSSGAVDGAVVTRLGPSRPWRPETVIARSVDEVKASAQSIYTPTSTNSIMGDLSALENESFAYVGTPDQVGSLRVLQKNGHPGANRVKFVFGPYVGTIMYESALESYVRSHGADGLGDIESVRYRDGDWPGYLSVKLTDGRVLKARKFYYNYLIPFHIANSCLMTPDFTNELTDISVGDAWNPTLESSGQGFSVVLARSRSGEDLLLDMESKGLVDLREIDEAEAISMHAHMLDFKKRGSFIRTSIRRRLGRAVPEFDYAPTDIGPSRVAIEMFIGVVLWTSRLRLSIWVSEKIPEPIIGRAFEYVRRSWKAISRSAKRQGLTEGNFEWTDKLKGNKR